MRQDCSVGLKLILMSNNLNYMLAESSRLQGNPSRRPWQSADHDGLLGSGSFPRPSGYAAGMIASKVQGNDHFQLKKSNEPYHPPRPYKVISV